jgi:aspartate aminotransferase
VSVNMTTRQLQNSPPSHSSARDRLASINNHIMPSPSVFTAANVAAAPEDPLFGLMKAYREDPSDKKVDLGIGAYRDNNAKPWILPVVKKVSTL